MNGIKVCTPNKIFDDLSEFLSIYSKAYCLDNDKISGICYRQSDDIIERDILGSTNNEYRFFARKIAWKLGRIKWLECTNINNIKYYKDWARCENENPSLYGLEFNLKRYYDDLNFEKIRYFCDINDLNSALEHITNCKIVGIGQVYSLAVLFFASDGKYPLYDRYVREALDYIFGDKAGWPVKGESKEYLGANAFECYDKYVNRIERLMDALGKNKRNYIEFRDLDRALWIYGHGFMR